MVGPNLRVRALSLVAIAGLAVSACGPGATPTSPPTSLEPGASPTATPETHTGGTLYLLMSTATANATQFTDMDPQRVYIGSDIAFFSATIQRSLTAYKYSTDTKEATSLVPDAATDTGTASDGGKTWSFTLKDGMKWEDGQPVTCEDFKYGASRTFATDVITNGPTYGLAYLDVPKNADGSSQYPGPYKATPEQQALFDNAVQCNGNTITYHLAKPIGDFNYTVTLGFAAVRQDADTGEDYTLHPLSDGPYMIDSYVTGNGGSLVLVRNPNWDPATDNGYRGAYPDRWIVQFGLDPKVMDARLIQPSGNDSYALQYGAIQPENLATIFSGPGVAKPEFAGRAFSELDPYNRYYFINIKTVPNQLIREAMAVALDRASIKKASGGDFVGDYADSLIKPNIGADYAPTGMWDTMFGQAIPPGGDVEFAKQLIAQSGEKAPTLTWDYGKSPVGDQIAAIIQSSLGAAGFTIKLNPIESGYYSYVYDTEKQHDFGPYGWGPDWPNASTVIPPLLTPDGGADVSRVGWPATDKWPGPTAEETDFLAQVDAALTDTDRASQILKWQALDKLAMSRVYGIPTFLGLNQTFAGDKVGNLYRWAAYGSWPYAQLYVMQ